ncbi:MAG: 50S ribosomal protein L24e [Candidatus Woesearchaeota archaeon]
MVNCSFCNKALERGTSKMFVYTSGKILYFCSQKCEKNMLKLNRKSRTTKWASTEKKK